jgi:hypothetical protein
MRDFQPGKPLFGQGLTKGKILIPRLIVAGERGLAEALRPLRLRCSKGPATIDNLLCGFLLDHDLQVRGHIFVQLDRYREFAHALERLVDLNLAAVDIKALFGQRICDVA